MSVNFTNFQTKIIIFFGFRYGLPVFWQPHAYGLFQTFEKRRAKSFDWSSKRHLQHQFTIFTRKCGTGNVKNALHFKTTVL